MQLTVCGACGLPAEELVVLEHRAEAKLFVNNMVGFVQGHLYRPVTQSSDHVRLSFKLQIATYEILFIVSNVYVRHANCQWWWSFC